MPFKKNEFGGKKVRDCLEFKGALHLPVSDSLEMPLARRCDATYNLR